MPISALTQPDIATVYGALKIQTNNEGADTYLSADNGLILTSGFGDIICTSILASGGGQSITAHGGTQSGDNSAAFISAITAMPNGGVVIVPQGTWPLAHNVPCATQAIWIMGQGDASIIQPTASFGDSAFFTFTADFCGIFNLRFQYANSTTASNPAADAILFSGAKHGKFGGLEAYYVNGHLVKSQATSSSSCASLVGVNCHAFNINGGISVTGHTNQNYLAQHKFSNIDIERSNGANHAFDLVDCADVKIDGLWGASYGSGVVLHVAGKANAVSITNLDIGSGVGTNPIILIEDSGGNSPTRIFLTNGFVQQGSVNLSVTGGASQLRFGRLAFRSAQTHGVIIANTASSWVLDDCTFSSNGVTNNSVTSYDFQSSTSGQGKLHNCQFLSSIGAGANQVTNPLNVTAGTILVEECQHTGTNHSTSNFYAGAPKKVRECFNFNDQLGLFSPQPAVPLTGVNTSALPFPSRWYIAGGTVTDVQVNNVSTGETTGYFDLLAGDVLQWVGSGAPTWKVFGK